MGRARIRNTAAAILAATAVLSGPAAARDPKPSPPDEVALAAAGIDVDWPFRGGYVSRLPGDTIRVGVRSRRHRVTISLVRISNHRGLPMSVVARRTLRRGTFRARLPRRWAVRYTLTLVAAGRRYRALIDTFRCPKEGREETRLTVARTTARRGESVAARLHNVGTTCLDYGPGYDWQRLRDGRWETIPNDRPVPTILHRLYPGGSDGLLAEVWPELEPGPHRLLYADTPSPPIEILP